MEDFYYMYDNTTEIPDIALPITGLSIFLGVLLAILSVVTLAGNIGTIWAFQSNILLRQKPSNLLILSLSCCDLVVGATGLPVASIHTGLGYWPLGKPVCIIAAFCSVIGVSAAMYTVMAIALDRWLLVSSEYSTYLRIQSSRNVKLQIAGAWGAAILISSIETILWISGVNDDAIEYTTECRSPVRKDPLFVFIIFVLLFAVPFSVMVLSTGRFVFLLRRRLRRQRARAPSASVKSHHDRIDKADELSSTVSEQSGHHNKVLSVNGKDVDGSGKPASPASLRAVVFDTTSTADSSSDTPANKPGRPAAKKHPSLAQTGRNKSFFGLGLDASRGASRRNRQAQKMKNRYIKPAVRLAILLGVYALCTLPYPFFLILADKSLVEARNHLSNLLLSNSGLNPFLYAIMHRKIRLFYVSKLIPSCCKKTPKT
ncbi:alpha-2A adrenergic receptor-like [Patiria miniata]|uniref:G-protein coupled receptors family 1 profile domain-containing protein n=1 Tax=Patiria miniata TaxID=46514 RepID=A0A914B086_PATMI|nr:alpha-2A adrenergic receptor-like [Patiria miniata]